MMFTLDTPWMLPLFGAWLWLTGAAGGLARGTPLPAMEGTLLTASFTLTLYPHFASSYAEAPQWLGFYAGWAAWYLARYLPESLWLYWLPVNAASQRLFRVFRQTKKS